ncbi:MAG: Meiotically up-regulated protein 66 [Lasallia pustulata]|uniref:Autophagy-related protein 101 n=1 Tax=Lasallia pustulata TaxID=136370 RepID=A0A5M8PUB5_9LECA|nr:MAG: Meiotically up-regulated protein 66 [Lasallia pustulata]
MEPRRPPEYILKIFADPTHVKDIIKGTLHTIFFHRYFPSIRPSSLEVLDLTLPVVVDPELETLVDTRVAQLIRQLSSTTSPNSSVRGQIAVQFFEKRRRKGGGLAWFGGGKGEEEICWEVWMVEVTLAMPRTEAERTKVLKAMETTLQKTAMKIVTIVNQHKEHIPPITTSEANPFPYQIILNPRSENWGTRIGIF